MRSPPVRSSCPCGPANTGTRPRSSDRSGADPRSSCCRYYRRRRNHGMERVGWPSTTCPRHTSGTKLARLRSSCRRRTAHIQCAPRSRMCPRDTRCTRRPRSRSSRGRTLRSPCGTGCCSTSPRYSLCSSFRPANIGRRDSSHTAYDPNPSGPRDTVCTCFPGTKCTPSGIPGSPCDLRLILGPQGSLCTLPRPRCCIGRSDKDVCLYHRYSNPRPDTSRSASACRRSGNPRICTSRLCHRCCRSIDPRGTRSHGCYKSTCRGRRA